MKTTDFKYVCSPEDAKRIAEWIEKRGGIQIWRSQLMGSGKTFTTPFQNEDGTERKDPPHWSAPVPDDHIAFISDVGVAVDREVKRFHVAIRPGSQGMSMKVTDFGSRRIRKETELAGDGAYHTFDYENQEAVIMAPEKITPLSEWLKV